MNAETRAKEIVMTPDDLAEGICAALARAEAAFDKRGWVEMPKADRNRYVERALLAKSLIAQALRQAQNDKLEEAERAILNEHSVAESADLNIGLLRAARAVKAIRLSTPEKD
jgi:hypothetical protein